jgi:cell fate regulator YaaT (PSP1 superfamily)
MAHLVEVAFKGNRRDFFRWDGAEPPRRGAAVIVEGDRGEDLGRVHATGELALKRYAGVAHGALSYGPLADTAPAADDGAGVAATLPGDGAGPQRRVLRAAAAADEARARDLPALDDTARRESAERVRLHALAMKVTDAEWQWDRRKLTLYFTAEKRVDFRALVRDLAAHFRARIELKQIGVRDEAKRLSGIGRCGREYCSAAWLPELRPVNLNVAKDQHLSLNPTQISGACGRLMCSLRYEHDFYVQQRKRFPKEGRVLATAKGEEKVVGNDIFRERVTLRAIDGELRVVPLGDLRAELDAAAAAADGTAGVPSDASRAGDTSPPEHPRPAPLDPPVDVGDVADAGSVAATAVPEPPPPIPATARSAAGPADAPADAEVDDADDADDADDTDDAEDPAESAPPGSGDAAATDRPRRRRGRRGGRRNRPPRPDAPA